MSLRMIFGLPVIFPPSVKLRPNAKVDAIRFVIRHSFQDSLRCEKVETIGTVEYSDMPWSRKKRMVTISVPCHNEVVVAMLSEFEWETKDDVEAAIRLCYGELLDVG